MSSTDIRTSSSFQVNLIEFLNIFKASASQKKFSSFSHRTTNRGFIVLDFLFILKRSSKIENTGVNPIQLFVGYRSINACSIAFSFRYWTDVRWRFPFALELCLCLCFPFNSSNKKDEEEKKKGQREGEKDRRIISLCSAFIYVL